MLAGPEGTSPLAAFDGLLDLERSRAFHEGRAPLGLSTMAALLEALPPRARPALCVHVAGSEGKTSTTERIAAGCRAYGLKTATYTSPHLVDARERLRIDFRWPTDEALRAAVAAVLAAARSASVSPSWFEALTATAVVLFGQQGVQAAVWETGLGGRLDATRLLPADVCVITTISLEHTAILGSTEAAIAREKAGILRPGAPLVLGPGVRGAAREVIARQAEELGCPLHQLSEAEVAAWSDTSRRPPTGPDCARAAAGGANLPGDVQSGNGALAAAVLDALYRLGRLPHAPETRVRAAIAAHGVAGRHQLVGDVLYDGAHTVAAVERLAARLAESQRQGGARGPVVFGATHGRDAAAMARALRAVAAPLVLTRAPGERGVDPHELLAALGAPPTGGPAGDGPLVVEPPAAALAEARRRAGPSARIVVTGSLHLVGLLWPPELPAPGTCA